MRPLLLIGPDKACNDYAADAARKNNYHFIPLEAEDFAQFEKNFYTSSLDGLTCLFYLYDAEKLSVDNSINFIEMIKDSPHRFILSASADANWHLRKVCIVSPLENVEPELTTQLRILLTEHDRNAVRLALINADVDYLFHILKFGAWQVPQALDSLIEIGRNLKIVHRSYILSMLTFAISPKPFSTRHIKRNENPLQHSIKSKIQKALPKLNPAQIAEVYLLLVDTHNSYGLELSDEEKGFLQIEDPKETEQAQAVFVKTANIGDYF